MCSLNDIVDTAFLSFFGGMSFYIIAFTFQVTDENYDLMVKAGIILGVNAGMLKSICF
jgi:hypothetical protein